MNASAREATLFQAALPLGGAERAAFLDRACVGDAVLRARLEALLAAHDQPDTLFGTGADAPRPTIALDLARDLADDLVGQTIGRYKLFEKIGEGGCGVVYVAEQTEPIRRRVALKIIKLGMDTREVIARFEAERQALAMMDHPNIAKVLDAGVMGQRSEVRGQRSAVSGQRPEVREQRAESGERRGGDEADPTLTSEVCPLTSGCGRPYFVMELVRGIKITDYCDQNRLSTKERLDLFIQVCHAIQHAHQKGIIHRDIKPSNVMVTLHDGVPVPKVIDFGIAKATEGRLTDATVYTQLHQFIGTPAYMSPEQAEMSGLDIDTRSDIYSLGVLLYELLTDVTPFDAKELMSQGIDAMRRTIREQEPVRPSTRLRQSALAAASGGASRLTDHASRLTPHASRPSDLDWIVMKCLEKDRARRYGTASGLAADLKRHLNHEPVLARPPSAAYRFQKAWRRNRLVFAAGAAVAATLVIGLGVSLLALSRAREAEREESQALTKAARALAKSEEAGETANREWERAEAELWNSRLSEARALRIAGGPGARFKSEVLLQQLVLRPNLTEPQMLALRQEAIGQLALVDIEVRTNFVATSGCFLNWNETLSSYAQRCVNGDVEVAAYPSQVVIARLEGLPGAAQEEALFSADGRFLAARFLAPTGVVRVWEIASQQLVLQTRDEQPVNVYDALFFTPDSRHLALPTREGLMLQALAPGSVPRFLQPGRIVHYLAFTSDSRRLAVFFTDRTLAVEVWDAETGETLHRFDPGVEPEKLRWHPDNERLAVAGGHDLAIWNIPPPGSPVSPTRSSAEFKGHSSLIVNLRLLPDGTSLLTSSWDGTSIIWDLVSGRPLFRETRMLLEQPGREGDQVATRWEPPRRETVCGLHPRRGLRTAARASRPVLPSGVWLSPDARLVAAASAGSTTERQQCALWDFARGVELGRVEGHWAQFSPDSRWLYVCGPEYPLRRYDVSPESLWCGPEDWSAGEEVYAPEPGHKLNACTLSADGQTMYLAAFNRVTVLDLEGRNPPRHLPFRAHAVSLNPDATMMETRFQNLPAHLYSLASGTPITNSIRFAWFAFSPDDRWLSSSGDHQLQILDRESLKVMAEIALDPSAYNLPRPSAFSPDSRMIAVPYNQVDLRLYRVPDGQELATLSAPGSARIFGGQSIEFSRDGQWLLALREDGEVSAWDLHVIRRELAGLGLGWEAAESLPAAPPADKPSIPPSRQPDTVP
jgi:serine/threonine protein kinase/WD40 repeat protein